jgi:hypothetical protein
LNYSILDSSKQRRKEMINKLIRDETGDVPGWVLITLMTAGLVVVMWSFAGPALQGVFQQAMNRVVSF